MTIEILPLGMRCQRACSYCMPEDTPVMLTDGRWKPIQDLKIGEQLVSFEHEPRRPNTTRRFVDTVVTGMVKRQDVLVKITTARGDVRSTPDHEWLVVRWGKHYRIPSRHVRPGDELLWLTHPVVRDITESRSYRAGWLAGVFTGDGTSGHYVNADGKGISSIKLYSKDQGILNRAILFASDVWDAELRQVDHKRKDTGAELSYVHITRAKPDEIEPLEAQVGRDPRVEDDDFARGWIAGFWDAEGSRGQLVTYQNDRAIMQVVVDTWNRFGLSAHIKEYKEGQFSAHVCPCSASTVARFLSEFRPCLVRKLSLGGQAIDRLEHVPVESVELGTEPQTVYDPQTKSLTYVASGWLTWDCYQEPIRDAGNESGGEYDLEAMKAALLREGHRFSVFGGEPLLVPLDDLEELFAFGKHHFSAAAAEYGQPANSIQTDGYLITDAHLRMFRRYDVGVGISIDGPGELNDARAMRSGGLEATRAATEKSHAALRRMLESGMSPSVITTLNRHNASAERLPRLIEWYRELHDIGLRSVCLHLLESESDAVRDSLGTSEEETVAALLACARLMGETALRFKPLTDMRALLLGEDMGRELANGNRAGGVSCIWNGCDPLTTDAVRGVDGEGNRRNCGRTYKDGVAMQKGDRAGFERYLALYHTPQSFGGCSGCRFFFACKGNCPGTGEGTDWRARTEHCGVLMAVFGRLEAALVAEGRQPLSLRSDRPAIERHMLAEWAAGRGVQVKSSVEAVRSGAAQGSMSPGEHQDIPHGDDHGDSDDPAWVAAHPNWREEQGQTWRRLE